MSDRIYVKCQIRWKVISQTISQRIINFPVKTFLNSATHASWEHINIHNKESIFLLSFLCFLFGTPADQETQNSGYQRNCNNDWQINELIDH